VLAVALALASCADKKSVEVDNPEVTDSITATPADGTAVANDTTATAVETEAPVAVTVKGKVSKIVFGKDGYTAQVKDDSGREYFATVSRSNLDDAKQYRELKVGDVITVKGESFKLEDELHIKVEDLK
jgi:lysyl-tRNA synthetase class II